MGGRPGVGALAPVVDEPQDPRRAPAAVLQLDHTQHHDGPAGRQAAHVVHVLHAQDAEAAEGLVGFEQPGLAVVHGGHIHRHGHHVTVAGQPLDKLRVNAREVEGARVAGVVGVEHLDRVRVTFGPPGVHHHDGVVWDAAVLHLPRLEQTRLTAIRSSDICTFKQGLQLDCYTTDLGSKRLNNRTIILHVRDTCL